MTTTQHDELKTVCASLRVNEVRAEMALNRQRTHRQDVGLIADWVAVASEVTRLTALAMSLRAAL